MNFSRIKLRHLQCIVAVGQERNLVRAAQAMALTQPAVSKTVAELEDILDRRLLVRRRRGVELTATGEAIMKHASSTLRALHEGLAQALEQPEASVLQVVAGALPNMAAGLLPAAVASLAQSEPDLRVRVMSGTNQQLMAQLRQGEVELVLGRLAQSSAMLDLSFQALYSEPLVLVAAPNHALATRSQAKLDDILAFPIVMPIQGTPVRDTADAYLQARGVRPSQRIVEATDTSFATAVVRCSDALWFAPQGVVRSALQRAEVVLLPFDTRSTNGPVGITVRRTGELGEGARRLVVAIEAEARAMVESGHANPL